MESQASSPTPLSQQVTRLEEENQSLRQELASVKKIHQASLERLEKLQSLLQQSQEIAHIGSFEMDAQNHTVFATPETYRILGVEGQVSDTNPYQLFIDATHPEDKAWVDDAVRHAIESNTLYSVEHRIVQPNGQERWIWSTGRLMHDSLGKQARLVGVIIDVTDKKRFLQLEETNQKLTARTDELDSFAYTASHDLRAPVNNMAMLLKFLAEEISALQNVKLQEKTNLYVGLLNTSLVGLKNTLEDLTTVTEIHPGEKKVLVNLHEVIEEVKVALYKQLEEAEGAIKVELDMPFLHIPAKHVRSLIINLLSNALKFRSLSRKLTVQIASYWQDGRVHVSIADNGIGIRQSDQDKIFMIFKRFNSHVAGRGIGMYLVKRVVDLNGGTIYLESQENMGTTFHIEFPMEKQLPAS